MNKLIRLVLVVMVFQLTACATMKKYVCPIFKPIHLGLGMTTGEVLQEFNGTPEYTVFEDGSELLVYRIGQGLSAARDRHARQLGGTEWYLEFEGGFLVSKNIIQYGE